SGEGPGREEGRRPGGADYLKKRDIRRRGTQNRLGKGNNQREYDTWRNTSQERLAHGGGNDARRQRQGRRRNRRRHDTPPSAGGEVEWRVSSAACCRGTTHAVLLSRSFFCRGRPSAGTMRGCGLARPSACLALCLLRAVFFFQAEDGIRDWSVTGVQTCALPI